LTFYPGTDYLRVRGVIGLVFFLADKKDKSVGQGSGFFSSPAKKKSKSVMSAANFRFAIWAGEAGCGMKPGMKPGVKRVA
jgi:hypothetical protein